METTILIVDDDEELSGLLSELLQEEGYHVLLAGDGVEAVQAVKQHHPDLVLLDILMPRMDGWETCRWIRELSDTPIIILSCEVGELDKVRGLDLGADDYITKPFSTLELRARVRAALRRANPRLAANGIVEVDGRLAIDRTCCEVFVDGQTVELTATECKLLTSFLDNAGRILTHQSLLTQVWGWEYADEKDYLKVYVYHLRKKIEQDPQNPVYILTERGLGYRFQIPPGI